jgi:hypothetical protein
VVIDEYFINSIFERHTVVYDDVIHTNVLLDRLTPSIELTLFKSLMVWMIGLIQEKTADYTQISYYIRKYVRLGGNEERIEAFCTTWELFLGNHYISTKHIFQNIITGLANMLLNFQEFGLDDLEYLQAMIQCISTDKAVFLDISWWNRHALQIPSRIILLDATTPPEFYKFLFNRKIKTMNASVEIFSTIYQITRGTYVMESLNHEDTFNRMAELVKLIVDKHNSKTLVVSRKKYEEKIKKISPLIAADHYPLVGSNNYEDYNN